MAGLVSVLASQVISTGAGGHGPASTCVAKMIAGSPR
jgi:hypothetical protein